MADRTTEFLDKWEQMFTPEGREAVGADIRALIASERAAATAACADLVQERKHRAQGARILAEQDDCFDFVVEKIVAEIRQWQSVEDEIRALSPEGWVGVRREDLDVVIAGWRFVPDWKVFVEVQLAAIERVGAALARGKGE